MRKRVTLAAFLTFGFLPLGLAAANFFPDQTWRGLTMAGTLYEGIFSRLMPSAANRHIQESREPDPRDLLLPETQPCNAHMSNEVEQIFANPQAFVHRIVAIRGQYLSGFEISDLTTCANGHIEALWVENAAFVVFMAKAIEQLPSRERWDVPILRFKVDEQKNAVAWRKLGVPGNTTYCSDVTLVGQFETKTPEASGFGHLSAYKHELIVLDVGPAF